MHVRELVSLLGGERPALRFGLDRIGEEGHFVQDGKGRAAAHGMRAQEIVVCEWVPRGS